jgi:hypothetical protein
VQGSAEQNSARANEVFARKDNVDFESMRQSLDSPSQIIRQLKRKSPERIRIEIRGRARSENTSDASPLMVGSLSQSATHESQVGHKVYPGQTPEPRILGNSPANKCAGCVFNQNNSIIMKESSLISRAQTPGPTRDSIMLEYKLETGPKNYKTSEILTRGTPHPQVSKSLIQFPSPYPETTNPKLAHYRQKFPAYNLGMSVGQQQLREMQLAAEEERPSLGLYQKDKDKPKIQSFNPFRIPESKLKLNGSSSKDTLSKQQPRRPRVLSARVASPKKVKSSQSQQMFSIPNKGPSPYGMPYEQRKTLDNCSISIDMSTNLDKRVSVAFIETTPEKFIRRLPTGSPEL